MKQLKNIIFLQMLLAALFFFFTEKQSPEISTHTENPTSEFSQEGLYSLAFIQPESVTHVVGNVKTFSFSVARLTDFLAIDFTNSIQLNLRKTFLFQDINRCETVSLLLFPFHFFW